MLRRLAPLALALLVCAGCAPRACEQAPPERLQLLLVNDVYRLEPGSDGRGGLARVATLVRGLRQETPRTVFALAGDTLSPSLLSTLVRGRQMIEAWNALGLDLATFGNHEFDFGPAALTERIAESRFVWVSGNVRDATTGRPFGGARPWLRRQLGEVRVGVIGLTTPDTAETSNGGPGVRFDEPIAAARTALGEMGPVDLRVGLTHLPLYRDRELASAVPLHVILGGHDHDPMVHEEGATLIIKAGADAVNVGLVQYEVHCGTVLSRRQRLIPVDATIAEAPDVAALVQDYAALVERELATPLSRTAIPLDARRSVTGRQETALGHFLAELMRGRVEAQVALLNSGAIRGDRVISPGPVTGRDVRELLPFNNTIVLLEVSGRGLLGALERSADQLPRPSSHHLQTAGVTYTVDSAQPPGRRIGAVLVQGRPLEPDRSYRVAVPDYLARGQDGYPMLARSRVLLGEENGPGLIETVVEALRQGRSP